MFLRQILYNLSHAFFSWLFLKQVSASQTSLDNDTLILLPTIAGMIGNHHYTQIFSIDMGEWEGVSQTFFA
jgi:hypothetical protein